MLARGLLLLSFIQVAQFTDPPCTIELLCEECLPENMPIVTSHEAINGSITVPTGGDLALACGGGKFLLYPMLAVLPVKCEAGRYRVRADGQLRHLLELGCQESVFEDVLHQVEQCPAPLQGRAYQIQRAGGVRHLATLCYDADRGVAAHLRAGSAPLALAPHAERAGPLSLLGNFNHMFDTRAREQARALLGDEARLTRRLRELVRHEGYSFAEQTLAPARLLAPAYFGGQEARAADFPSNWAASWRGVVQGNLRLLQADVAALARRRPLRILAGTHGTLRLSPGAEPLHLRAGGRLPVPRYLWTAVLAADGGRGMALVLLNEPLVPVSAIREAVFCESRCGSAAWLARLLRHRNYERPAAGLVFCCDLREFAERVPEMPKIFNDTVKLLL